MEQGCFAGSNLADDDKFVIVLQIDVDFGQRCIFVLFHVETVFQGCLVFVLFYLVAP